MVLELTDQNFEKEVLEADGVVLVDFWATWCVPCKMLKPVLEEVAEEVKSDKGIKICKLDVDKNTETAQKHGIMSIPVLKLFKKGEVVDELVGMQSKEDIIRKLENLQ